MARPAAHGETGFGQTKAGLPPLKPLRIQTLEHNVMYVEDLKSSQAALILLCQLRGR